MEQLLEYYRERFCWEILPCSLGGLCRKPFCMQPLPQSVNYAQPSLELGFAFKFIRLGLLILTGCFGLWGFAGGILLSLILYAVLARCRAKAIFTR